jgi:hypothetical protein
MKLVKKSLRVWLTIASVFSFLGGWVILSHSNKPAPLQIGQPAISSPASNLPSTGNSSSFFSQNSSSSGILPFTSQLQSRSFSPRLRTGGS